MTAEIRERRIAIILCNLGGPDSLAAVRPFLFNLFNDRAIIALPQPARAALATLIAALRTKSAQANYALMGGASPLLRETEDQAAALDAQMAARGIVAKCFVAMRYWRPFSQDAARAAKTWGATEALILPLYPQFSSATTASSLAAWRAASDLPARAICCYPNAQGFIQAHADAILSIWKSAGSPPNPRVLFSAHGLPKRTIEAGDSYQWQVERTAAAVRALLPSDWSYRQSYQSRVGPLEWLGPSTRDEIDAAARDGIGLIVSPIAFVSDHVETLVELDIEYATHAKTLPFYLRAPALKTAPAFIEALADLACAALDSDADLVSEAGGRICPAAFGLCPHRATAPVLETT